MFSDAANAGASGAAFIRRTWLTRNNAACVTPQMPIAAARPSGEWMFGTSVTMPAIMNAQNVTEAISG
ncbi:hypothetical protein D3C84_943050 [compost metagenome]